MEGSTVAAYIGGLPGRKAELEDIPETFWLFYINIDKRPVPVKEPTAFFVFISYGWHNKCEASHDPVCNSTDLPRLRHAVHENKYNCK
jgi:hypothetical protein